jgi:putative flippase GtrA
MRLKKTKRKLKQKPKQQQRPKQAQQPKQLIHSKWLPNKRFVSFVFVGGLNTGVTYLLYLLLSNVTHYQIAYLIAYLTGIVLAYLLNLRFVFNAQSSLKKMLRYPFIYVIQYLLGAGLMYVMLELLNLPNVLAPLLVTLLLLPISYYMNKIILHN